MQIVADAIEQPFTDAKEGRDDVDLHLVDEAGHRGPNVGERFFDNSIACIGFTPSRPCIDRQAMSGKTHSCRRMPPMPSGLSTL